MGRLLFRGMIAAVLLSFATPSLALFNAQLLAGKRWYVAESDGEKSGVSAMQVGVSALLDPIPLVPVAFGLGLNNMTLNTDDMGSDVDTASIFEAGLEVHAWAPIEIIVKPYARLNIPLMAKYAVAGKQEVTVGTETSKVDFAGTGSLSGYHLNVGAKMSLIPLVAVMFEVGMSSQSLKMDEYKVDGDKVDLDGEKTDFNSQSVLLGVEVGF